MLWSFVKTSLVSISIILAICAVGAIFISLFPFVAAFVIGIAFILTLAYLVKSAYQEHKYYVQHVKPREVAYDLALIEGLKVSLKKEWQEFRNIWAAYWK